MTRARLACLYGAAKSGSIAALCRPSLATESLSQSAELIRREQTSCRQKSGGTLQTGEHRWYTGILGLPDSLSEDFMRLTFLLQLRSLIVLSVLLVCPVDCKSDDPDRQPDEVAAQIDQLMATEWQREGLVPTVRSSDEEFCRRAWLDLAGVAPSFGELRDFLEDDSPTKRAELIDNLLASPLHSRHMAAIWLDILLKDGAIDPSGNALQLEEWLRQQFQDNVRYDAFVADFMTAGGAQNVGPAIFFTSLDLQPERVASETSKIFLGLDLQCAQCHDHPTKDWKQTDFWSYAAFFSQLERSDSGMGRQVYLIDRSNRELTIPDSEIVASPRYPGIAEAPEPDIDNNRRRQLTVWMASRDNQYLVRAAIDRVWSHLMGSSLIDRNRTNILNLLETEFIDRRFDLRAMFAIIARTETYGRSSKLDASTDNRSNDTSTSITAMPTKTLTARQYYDSLIRNVYRQPPVVIAPQLQSAQQQRLAQRFIFLSRMKATNAAPTSYSHGIVQSLGLLNGPEIAQVTHADSRGLMSTLKAPFLTDQQRIDVLYMSTLSRKPSSDEVKQCLTSLSECQSEEQRTELMADILWTLLNTTECMLCP